MDSISRFEVPKINWGRRLFNFSLWGFEWFLLSIVSIHQTFNTLIKWITVLLYGLFFFFTLYRKNARTSFCYEVSDEKIVIYYTTFFRSYNRVEYAKGNISFLFTIRNDTISHVIKTKSFFPYKSVHFGQTNWSNIYQLELLEKLKEYGYDIEVERR